MSGCRAQCAQCAHDVIVTHGAQQALDLIGRVLNEAARDKLPKVVERPAASHPCDRVVFSLRFRSFQVALSTTRRGSRAFASVHIKEGFAMVRKHPFLYGLVITVCIAALGLVVITHATDDDAPSSRQIAFAQEVSDLMVNELVAALFQEFNETTPQNVEHGKQAISLVFNDLNRDMRLVGAFGPLLGGANDRPADRFETTALRRALTGESQTAVQKVNDTWYYRRSVPLSNTLHQSCVLCHTNFTADFFNGTNNPGQWAGTLVLRVPIKSNSGHQ
jgi:hypothetical protein